MFRRISADNIAYFQRLVQKTNWHPVLTMPDGNGSYNTFAEIVKDIYDKALPFVEVEKHRKSRKPWIDTFIKRIKRRDMLFALLIKTKELDYLAQFKN